MSQNPEWRSVRVGLLVTAALVVAGLAIIGISSRQNLFERKVTYFSLFPDAAGLKEGNGVWYQGVEVGFITSIDFTRDLDVQKVVVHYKIKSSLVPRMRSGTRASIRTLGLLGDKYLALTTPSATEDEPIILPGSQIPIDVTVNLAALGRGAQDLMENSLELSKNVNKIAALLVEGDGALPKLLNDPELGKQTIDNLESIGRSMDRIATTLAAGKGLAGRVLMDEKYGGQVSDDLAAATKLARLTLEDIRAGKGGAGAFLAAGGQGERLVANLTKTSEVLARAADAMETSGTLSNKFFMDEEYGEHMAANLLSISDSLASILKKVDRGEGTLGALINDRSVYDSLAAVSEGMRKSALVGWYLQRKAEKAARAARDREKQGQKP